MNNTDHPFPGNQLRHVELDPKSADYGDTPEVSTDLDAANLVTSEYLGDPFSGSGMHRLVIDIDHPVKVVESSTPGHFHLYIDLPMPWSHALEVLEAMAYAGIVEPGYVAASKARNYTAVRLPWIRKAQAAAVTA